MGARALVVDLGDPHIAAEQIVAHAQLLPLDAVVAVDEQGVEAAALAAQRLGLVTSSPAAIARTKDKAAMRVALADAAVPQPAFKLIDDDGDAARMASEVGFPCVVKPVSLSASRGVIRADDPEAALTAAARIREILDAAGRVTAEPLLVEEYIPGDEVAVEGLLRGGALEVLAIFDKPDPLTGPCFEETIYVTPSRHTRAMLDAITRVTAAAARAIGLTEGPVHAELRCDSPTDRCFVIEVAARSIGGLCSRALRFGAGVSLEEVILRHALSLPLDALQREEQASGVMMLPIPARGVLQEVSGREQALATPGIVGLDISIPIGRPVVPLPDSDRYLGFLFARGPTPEGVEQSLRTAFAALEIDITL